MKLKPPLSLLLVWMTLLTFLPATPARTATSQVDDKATKATDGLRFRLSEGTETVETPTPNPIAVATSLSEVEIRKLLARLPTIKPSAADTLPFKLRERSLPPPRAGETIQAAFASSAINAPAAPANVKGALEVTRVSPEGEVSLAPVVSVTFSQPMVAVSSQEEAAANVPVTLTPQPDGKWRWLGTQTLIFQPDAEGGRLPMATSYTLNVPAGTKSALGNALSESKTFTFATPPPTVKNSYPGGESQPRDALMFLEFDQRINEDVVLKRLELKPLASGLRLRRATAEEIASDPSIKEFIKRAQEGRWLVFRAVDSNGATKDALPSDTNIEVVVPPGTPSAEGGRSTLKEQSFTFKTYGPLRVSDTQCGYQKRCSPFDSFVLTFNNQVDVESFQPAHVKITPDIPDVKITLAWNSINIEGVKRSNTSYTVTLDRAIKDTFNQTLTGNNQFIFKVTKAEPSLFATGGDFVVLDPAGPRAFTVYSINYTQLRVALYRVAVDDWQQFRRYRTERYSNPKVIPEPPGKLVFDKVLNINAPADQLTETAIDLSLAFNDGYGQAFIKVEPVESPEDRKKAVKIYADRENKAEAWVQSTEIGLEAFADRNELVAWTNSLKDGGPLAGVEINVSPDDLTGPTGTNGLAILPFKDPSKTKEKQPPLIVARRGKDVAILSLEYSPYYYAAGDDRSWRRDDASVSLSWYVFDDRKLYRPGEEVNVKGWIRQINRTPMGGTELYPVDPEETLNYILEDSQDNEITKGSVKLNALAGFNAKVPLPATMNLGGAHIKFQFGEDGSSHYHYFQVQEFRRPEFEITVHASEAPHFVGSFATATMTAAYYSGGGLAATEVDWTVTSTPTNYTPPNRDDYTFGNFYAWWRNDSENNETKEQTLKGRTDAQGKHTLRMDFDGVNPPRASSVMAQARVQDVNRQTLAGTAMLLVHPADVYVGLKSARNFVQKGEAFDIATIVTDLDGKALENRDVSLRLVRLDYGYEKGEWKQQESDVQERTVKSGRDAVNTRFQTREGGIYSLTARVRDDRERLNESELLLWVAGGKLPPKRDVAQEKVELIPDRKNYADNDVAEILVQAPFAPAEGVLTVRRSGLLRTERFTMNDASYTLRVPIEEAMTPDVHVQVDLVGAAVRVDDQGNPLANLPKRPAFASGEIELEIPPTMRRLSVKATPRETVLEPGSETLIDVEVKDARGQSVPGTDTAVVVVDESVLALTSYRLADPLSIFYEKRGGDVNDYHLREKMKLADPEEIAQLLLEGPGVGGGGGGAREIQSLPVNGRNYVSLQRLSEGTANSLNASASVEITG
ncbi:MAG: Ig-like domain-containing protein, partial [Acidobacteriota bacterium]|nr:Ig-like domain-containing protein [Acidobacteriota bacterium]